MVWWIMLYDFHSAFHILFSSERISNMYLVLAKLQVVKSCTFSKPLAAIESFETCPVNAQIAIELPEISIELVVPCVVVVARVVVTVVVGFGGSEICKSTIL